LQYNLGFQDYNIQLWDTAGLEKYRSITKSYFHSAAAIFLLVDVTDPFSLVKLDRWIVSIEESMPSESVCKIVLVLTKTDQEKQIDMDFFKEIAERSELSFYEVSSKTGRNVNSMFEKVIREAIVMKNRSYLEKAAESFKGSDYTTTKGSVETNNCSSSLSLSSNAFKTKTKTDPVQERSKCSC